MLRLGGEYCQGMKSILLLLIIAINPAINLCLRFQAARPFCYPAPKLWNNLPSSISSLYSLSSFKCYLRTYLFKKAFNLL